MVTLWGKGGGVMRVCVCKCLSVFCGCGVWTMGVWGGHALALGLGGGCGKKGVFRGIKQR